MRAYLEKLGPNKLIERVGKFMKGKGVGFDLDPPVHAELSAN